MSKFVTDLYAQVKGNYAVVIVLIITIVVVTVFAATRGGEENYTYTHNDETDRQWRNEQAALVADRQTEKYTIGERNRMGTLALATNDPKWASYMT